MHSCGGGLRTMGERPNDALAATLKSFRLRRAPAALAALATPAVGGLRNAMALVTVVAAPSSASERLS